MAVIQVRVDDDLKDLVTELYDSLGIDVSTAVRMFLKKSIVEFGLPFDAKIDEATFNGIMAVKRMQKISRENGNSEMSLEEINGIIRKAREEMDKKENK